MSFLSANPLLEAYNGSDLFGKAIFISLFLLSMATWIIFLQKFFLQRDSAKKGSKFQETFQKKRLNPLFLEAREAAHPFADLYSVLKTNTLELLNKNSSVSEEEKTSFLSRSDIDLIETHLFNSISLQSKKMEKNLFILSTVVSLAPFLGLLGTVWGILLTFAELKAGGGNTNETIMGGLAMALGTTVVGLLVAIPALIAYNYLKAATARFTADMEDFSHLMLASVELQYRQVDVQR